MTDHDKPMSMVEKAARAICVAVGHEPDATNSMPLQGSYWTDDGEPHWKGYVSHARAAISAIKSVSPEVIQQAVLHNGQGITNSEMIEGVYHAVINAILSEWT